MAASAGLNQLKFSDQDMLYALLVVSIGVLTYETVSKSVDKIANKELSKLWATPLVTSMSVMIIASTMTLPQLKNGFIPLCLVYVVVSIRALHSTNASSLPYYVVDMVEEAKRGAYLSKIGYEEAVKKVEVLMNKKTKPNALLIGYPGVGKSTIPETIAYKIATEQYSSRSPFFGAKLIRADFTDLMAGTMYRGSLEQRIHEMIQLAKKDRKIIYFIDEIHKLAGGGQTTESRVDVSEMLLPVMARGEIRVIGASTVQDYKKYIQPKEAFARRLPQVLMYEPNPTLCFQMLQHSYRQMSEKSCIKISNQAIAAAILFSIHIKQRYFPDKAIDLIDDAISAAELELGDTEDVLILTEGHIAVTFCTNKQGYNVEGLLLHYARFIQENSGCFPGLVVEGI